MFSIVFVFIVSTLHSTAYRHERNAGTEGVGSEYVVQRDTENLEKSILFGKILTHRGKGKYPIRRSDIMCK